MTDNDKGCFSFKKQIQITYRYTIRIKLISGGFNHIYVYVCMGENKEMITLWAKVTKPSSQSYFLSFLIQGNLTSDKEKAAQFNDLTKKQGSLYGLKRNEMRNEIVTSQELRMLSRSLSDCKSLLLNLKLNLNRCLCLCSVV